MSDLKFIRGCIYKAVEPYDEERPEFDHYLSEYTGNFGIGDCMVCDSDGNIHPGYCNCGVPVCAEALSEIVGHISNEGECE